MEIEQVLGKFPRRCPYCDEILPDGILQEGVDEGPIICPYCGRTFIRVKVPWVEEKEEVKG